VIIGVLGVLLTVFALNSTYYRQLSARYAESPGLPSSSGATSLAGPVVQPTGESAMDPAVHTSPDPAVRPAPDPPVRPTSDPAST